jgi:hypothetical protein
MKPWLFIGVLIVVMIWLFIGNSRTSTNTATAQPNPLSSLEITTEFKKEPDMSAFADIFETELGIQSSTKKISWEAYAIGNLHLSSGKIVGCDFGMVDSPFQQDVPKGSFPVLLAIAKFETDERVAFARVKFAEGKAARWEMALWPGQRIENLKPGQLYGYPVDSGTGSFAEPSAIKEFHNAIRNDHHKLFSQISEKMKNVYRHTWNFAQIRTSNGNIVLFSSGNGDGRYPSYFGFDNNGKLVALVTDFLLVDWDPKR